ncbi:MAG: hypothetical protein GQ541_04275 [Desulfovibrionaceae bacterium]|nr:hypothetical protein [Desulfovibrionaceae bacterium]
MVTERKHQRISAKLNVGLCLYDQKTETKLTREVSCFLSNISRQGAGLKIPQILIDGKHLCYAALDSDTINLILIFHDITDETASTVILARPIWFDRDMDDSALPFKIGVEFLGQTSKELLQDIANQL